MRLFQDVGELIRRAEVVGAVADLVGDVGLVAEVGTRLQDVFAVLEGSRVREEGAVWVLNMCSVPPRLPRLRLPRCTFVLPAQSQFDHVPQALVLAECLRISFELILVELDLVLVAHSALHRAIPCLQEANRGLLLAGISECLDDLGLLAGENLRPEYCLGLLPAILLLPCFDLGCRWLLAIPLVDEPHFGLRRLNFGALVGILLSLPYFLGVLLLLLVLLHFHQIYCLVIGSGRRGPRLHDLFWGKRAVLVLRDEVLPLLVAMSLLRH